MERGNIMEINKYTDCRLPAGPHLFLTRIRRRTDPQAGAGGGHPVATQIQRLYTYNGFHRTESHWRGREWAVGDNIQVSLTVKVPACRWHKKGVPYLDTFYSLHLTDGNLELRNTEGDTSIATCRSTEGRANRRKYVCPKCGKIHPFPDMAFCKIVKICSIYPPYSDKY